MIGFRPDIQPLLLVVAGVGEASEVGASPPVAVVEKDVRQLLTLASVNAPVVVISGGIASYLVKVPQALLVPQFDAFSSERGGDKSESEKSELHY